MTAAFVRAEGLVASRGGRRVLDGVDLVAHGGIVSVLGPNGAGKTTLLRHLATVVVPDAGTITIDGLDPRGESERTEIRRRLGYAPQDVGVVEGATVYDTVDYLAVLKGERNERHRRCAVFDVLDRVGLRAQATTRVERLSGGMRRRLGIAQALLGSPSLLLLDEPGAGLDPDERLRLREIVTERRATTTVVVSTHLIDDAAISDLVLVLDDGTVRFAGTPGALAAVASGRTWTQRSWPPPDVRASWRLPDGRHRCLGMPPPGADLVDPTMEDGYLLVRSPTR